MERLHLQKDEIVFAAFGGWDAYGAKHLGYATLWMNRFNLPAEKLGKTPDKVSTNLDGQVDFVLGTSQNQQPDGATVATSFLERTRFKKGERVTVGSTQIIDVGKRVPSGVPIGHWAAIPLRLIVGYGFVAHGYAKVINGPGHFVSILHSLGVPAPELFGWLTILIELVGGIAVLLGAFVSVFSLPMAGILLVAMFTVHLPYGFSSIKLGEVTSGGPQFGPPGYEVDLLYLACLSTLVFGGLRTAFGARAASQAQRRIRNMR